MLLGGMGFGDLVSDLRAEGLRAQEGEDVDNGKEGLGVVVEGMS
jgi:hypothetical protein